MFKRRSRPAPEVTRSEAEWRETLSPETYRVLRRSGTEMPGTSDYEHPPADRAGVYRCAGCSAELFRAADQFDSGSGWPSFTTPADADAVGLHTDYALLVPRREAVCTRCGGHLGHVFRDGPAPTGERWCINGAALDLTAEESSPVPDPADPVTGSGPRALRAVRTGSIVGTESGVGTGPARGRQVGQHGSTARTQRVTVWWLDLDSPTLAAHWTDEATMDGAERSRAARLARTDDRRRFVAGTVLLRTVLGAASGVTAREVRIDRTCPTCAEPHGRPRGLAPGAPYVSLTRAGRWVGVAACDGAPVGLDAEDGPLEPTPELLDLILDPADRVGVDDRAALLLCWTRKEAVVKATGDGLTVELARVRVSGPGEAAALLDYPGGADPRIRLVDLHGPEPARAGFPAAAVAVLTAAPISLQERRAVRA